MNESNKQWKHSVKDEEENEWKDVLCFLELIDILNQFSLLVTIAKCYFIILESLITQLSIVKIVSLFFNFHHHYVICLAMYMNFQGPK